MAGKDRVYSHRRGGNPWGDGQTLRQVKQKVNPPGMAPGGFTRPPSYDVEMS